MPDTTGHRIIW